jgi:predicted TIM-barrel fold metal-dependent hydrolase
VNELAARALRGDALADELIIDWHVHLGRLGTLSLSADGDESLMRGANAVGVTRLVVFGTHFIDLSKANEAVAAYAARHPGRVIGFAVTNPYQHDMVAEVRRCFDEFGFRGVKLHIYQERPLSPRAIASYVDEWDRLFAFTAERQAPVLFHGIVTEAMIRAWPGVPFVEAHGIHHVDHMQRLAKYPNYHVDTSWSQNTAWCVRTAVDLLGEDRVLWATDAPLADFAQRLGVVLDSDLSTDAMRKILGQNAARLLRLNTTQGEGTQ